MERSIQTPKGAIANEQNYPKTLSCNLYIRTFKHR